MIKYLVEANLHLAVKAAVRISYSSDTISGLNFKKKIKVKIEPKFYLRDTKHQTGQARRSQKREKLWEEIYRLCATPCNVFSGLIDCLYKKVLLISERQLAMSTAH